ncbi:MAG: acyl-CoA/acyl-ACP dehydrogenase [Candidatus Tectomicrobia bacterium]|uniref:Acyl-CoA/acyl-ACP dehydrogenase n=1 Tax=Tectimicrobiota bacterium TaxID=2528274 RepID=A0A932HZN3_UNCTE|nr:acyl-CoA/acyl-ACP dehydrogenase [Candidatus Tectomicrobia bacterium]
MSTHNGLVQHFRLTEQQIMLRDTVRKFVKEEIVPVRAELDREPDPKKGFSWELLRKADKLGLRTLALGEEDGGVEADIITRCVMGEEMATGDLGFAVCLDQIWKISGAIVKLCNEEQKKRFIPMFRDDPECVLSICITEPSGGSNYMLPMERKETIQTRARFENGNWLLNGSKVFISNAGLSKLYLVFAMTDPEADFYHRFSVFLVPSSSPGFSIGKTENKMGQRLVWNSTVNFDDCTIPASNLVGKRGDGMPGVLKFLAEEGSNIQAGATVLGTARAAYEAAVEHAKQRFIGGKLMIHHQLTHHKLASMKMRLDAARAYLYRAALNIDDPEEETDFSMPPMAKVFAAEMAFDVAKEALEIFGAYGYMKDAPMEKYFRDAASFLHSDGVNDVLLLRAARLLYDLPAEMYQ